MEGIALGVSAEQVVSYLDEKLFSPFLGEPEVILEIGPGGGRFTEILLPKCRKLIAADIAPSMLELLKERFGENKIEYRVLDGLGLTGIMRESIDAVFSYAVFAHLQHWDMYNYLREMKRVLKPGGKGIVEDPRTFSEFGWKRFIDDMHIQLNVNKQPGTISVMTPEIIREFTERAGLVLERCDTEISKDDTFALFSKPV
jgi:ubiquinone/menaquinone biosynthesis C-methylase UbiE